MRVRELRVTYRARGDLNVELGTPLNTPRLVAEVVIPMLTPEAVEVAIVLCFSTKHRLLCTHELSRGTLDCTIIHPREVFKAAILANSAGIVLAHNHPSGDPAPSADDLRLTARLVQAVTSLASTCWTTSSSPPIATTRFSKEDNSDDCQNCPTR